MICAGCWRPIEEKLKGKGRPKRRREMVRAEDGQNEIGIIVNSGQIARVSFLKLQARGGGWPDRIHGPKTRKNTGRPRSGL